MKYLYVGSVHNDTYIKQFTASETVMPHHAINCLPQVFNDKGLMLASKEYVLGTPETIVLCIKCKQTYEE